MRHIHVWMEAITFSEGHLSLSLFCLLAGLLAGRLGTRAPQPLRSSAAPEFASGLVGLTHTHTHSLFFLRV